MVCQGCRVMRVVCLKRSMRGVLTCYITQHTFAWSGFFLLRLSLECISDWCFLCPHLSFSDTSFFLWVYLRNTQDTGQASYGRRPILSPCKIRRKKSSLGHINVFVDCWSFKNVPLDQLVHEMSSKNKENKARISVKPPQPLYHLCPVLKCHT